MIPHYIGDAGVRYFNYQNAASAAFADLEARKFARWISPGDTVLDFGSGSGSILANLDCSRRIGIEVNPAARVEGARHGIEFHSSLAEMGDASVDVVISNHALEHVSAPMEVLCEMRRVLKTGGLLALCVPIDDWRSCRHYRDDDINHHLYTWTPQLLGNLLGAAGYRVTGSSFKILTQAFPGRHGLSLRRKLPESVFAGLCWFVSAAKRRRQILAVVRA